MAKLLLNLGYLDLADTRFYLTDVNMLDQKSKADTSDPDNNNEIMTGKSTWQFSATILKNEAISISPGSYSDARLSFGGQLWYGLAVIIQCSLVGKIDNAVIYNVTGEFQSPSRHLELVWQDIGATNSTYGLLDTWQWMDDDNNGFPNGSIRYGSLIDGVWTLQTNLYHRRYRVRNSGGGPVGLEWRDVNWESGETYQFFIRYNNVTTIGGQNAIYTSASTLAVNMLLSSGFKLYDTSHVATSGWDRVSLRLWGDLTFPGICEYYFIFIGKIINSI